METITKQGELQLALYHLLFQASEARRGVKRRVVLEGHPFRLNIPASPHMSSVYADNRTVIYLGKVGVTGVSVGSMCLEITEQLAEWYEGPTVDYLREIFVATEADQPDHHDVFFEIGFPSTTVICGGCTDCSGEGGGGRQKLETVFSFLEHLYGVTREVVKIAPRKGKAMEQRLALEVSRA